MNQNPDLSLIVTIHDRDLIVSDLERLESTFFKAGSGGEEQKILDEAISALTRDLVSSSVKSTSTELSDMVGGLKKQLLSLPVAHLVLAVAPNRRFIEEMAVIIRSKTRSNYLMDIQFDPGIVAGVKLEIGGRISDLSFRPKLEKYLSAHDPT